jgi:hypothetical protein
VSERFLWLKKHRGHSVSSWWSSSSSTRTGYFEACLEVQNLNWYICLYLCSLVSCCFLSASYHKVLRASSILWFYIRQMGLRCSYVCVFMYSVFSDKFKPIDRSSQNLVWRLWCKRPPNFCTFLFSVINNINISVQTSGVGAVLVVFGVGSLKYVW